MRSGRPEVSVVMGVHNGASALRNTLESVLGQNRVDLELIVVNDGSTDETGLILEEYVERDPRVRSFYQQHRGLTKALVLGCEKARGKYIARQDCGDLSVEGRFRRQLDVFRENPDAAMVSCATRLVGPQGEFLYKAGVDPAEIQQRLLTLDISKIRGPHHGSVMFSRNLYKEVGGYRSSFYFGQDLDLWIRLAERGKILSISGALYEAKLTSTSISGLYRDLQLRTTQLILEGARRRRNGITEQPILDRVREIRPDGRKPSSRRSRSRFHYFIGMCLFNQGRPSARDYFVKSLLAYPLHLKSLIRLLQTAINSLKQSDT